MGYLLLYCISKTEQASGPLVGGRGAASKPNRCHLMAFPFTWFIFAFIFACSCRCVQDGVHCTQQAVAEKHFLQLAQLVNNRRMLQKVQSEPISGARTGLS